MAHRPEWTRRRL